jgi:hypothetical protein
MQGTDDAHGYSISVLQNGDGWVTDIAGNEQTQ